MGAGCKFPARHLKRAHTHSSTSSRYKLSPEGPGPCPSRPLSPRPFGQVDLRSRVAALTIQAAHTTCDELPRCAQPGLCFSFVSYCQVMWVLNDVFFYSTSSRSSRASRLHNMDLEWGTRGKQESRTGKVRMGLG